MKRETQAFRIKWMKWILQSKKMLNIKIGKKHSGNLGKCEKMKSKERKEKKPRLKTHKIFSTILLKKISLS